MDDQRFRLEEFMPFRLSVTSNIASKVIASAYENRFGLAIPEWRLVAVLAESGPLTQQAIVGRTAMDKVTVSRAAQGLLARRLLQRAPKAEDRRSHHLSLTDEGRRLYEDVIPVALAFEAQLLKTFTADDRAQLAGLLGRIQDAARDLTPS